MPSQKTIARLEAQILRRAAYCLQFEVSDPRSNFITITRVELSSDVSSGKIFYSVMGGEADISKAGHMLKHAAGFIQRQVARVLRLRNMPRLDWYYDVTVAESMRVNDMIRDALHRDREISGEPEPESHPEPEGDGGADA